MFAVIRTSSGEVVLTDSRIEPIELAAAPLASGAPTVSAFEVCTGGLQDGNASGAPWVLLPVPVHCLKAGTSEALMGEAPLGRTCVALATWLATMSPSAPMARTSGSTIFLLMVI